MADGDLVPTPPIGYAYGDVACFWDLIVGATELCGASPVDTPPYELIRLNGNLLLYGPSATPAIKVDGEDQDPAKQVQISGDELYIDFNDASGWFGTLENIQVQKCDPATGEVLDTQSFDAIDWFYETYSYTLSDTPVLEEGFAYKATLQLNLSDGVDTRSQVIPVGVVSLHSVTLISVEGITVNEAMVDDPAHLSYGGYGSISQAVYAYNDEIPGFDPGPDLGPYSAVVKIDGVNYDATFINTGW